MQWLAIVRQKKKRLIKNIISLIKAIEKSNKQRLLKVNPKLDDEKVPIIYRHCQHTFEVL